ncbi:hypothetical protein BH23GEM6_BH23GEM6_24120 [soil metagenome]
MCFSEDFQAAAGSVRRFAVLEPEVLLAGHGRPLGGTQMRDARRALAAGFAQVAGPKDRLTG